jgi:hypothetical protein
VFGDKNKNFSKSIQAGVGDKSVCNDFAVAQAELSNRTYSKTIQMLVEEARKKELLKAVERKT